MWIAAAMLGLLAASGAAAQVSPAAADPSTAPPPVEETRRMRRPGGDEDAVPTPPDLSVDFDPFAPDQTPPPRPPRFDPRGPSLSAEADPLAALIRNGPAGAVLSPSQSPEPWMLPGTRRTPTLADPPPGSAPATRPVSPRAPEG